MAAGTWTRGGERHNITRHVIFRGTKNYGGIERWNAMHNRELNRKNNNLRKRAPDQMLKIGMLRKYPEKMVSRAWERRAVQHWRPGDPAPSAGQAGI